MILPFEMIRTAQPESVEKKERQKKEPMAAPIVVIDTETTWTDQVMSLGAVIANGETFQPVDSRYFLVDPYYRRGGMYSDVLRLETTPEACITSRRGMVEAIRAWLASYGVETICAYNALFDKNHMPELSSYRWVDIMRIAAYRQFNAKIPGEAVCCRTGRLKCGYGVEPIYRLLSENCSYYEIHNGWHDAMDELKIMELLDLPLGVYDIARI